MEDKIYKAIQVKTPKDNPDHSGLFETNHGKVIFRDGKWLFDKNDVRMYDKELYWYKEITKAKYLDQFKKDTLLEFLYWWMPEIHSQDAHSQIRKFEDYLLTKQK